MSLQVLQTTLQKQVTKNNAFVIAAATITDATLTPCADFDKTVQSYLVISAPLSVATTVTVPAPTGATLTVSGTASILGLASIPVQVTFSLNSGNTVDVLIVAGLPDDWNFISSFMQLAAFPFTDITLTQP